MKNEKIDYQYLKEKGFILYEVISGSIAYGTNLPNSDVDKRYVYILPIEYVLSGNVIHQVNDETNDVVGYEVGRFLDLISTANPNLLELLNMPEDCIIYKNPIFDEILNNRDKFLTKKCKNSFAGYSISQINKAKGQDKKQNWEKDKVTRKDVLDFVYVIEGEKSIPWKVWNQYKGNKKYEEKFIGAVNVPNARDVYALYYDKDSYERFSDSPIDSELIRRFFSKLIKPIYNKPYKGLGYKGLIKLGEGINDAESNQLRLSSIPKGEYPVCIITYNKDGYTQHCKDFKSYQEWLDNRNEARWIDVKSHGQKIDGKNMMHCMRLMQMAREIGEGKGINVRRENAKELISIRKGEVDLETLISKVQSEIVDIDDIFNESNLPEFVNLEMVNNLLISIRKKVYNL
jgi:hypothetical protein